MKNKILGMFLVLGMFMVFAAPTHASTLDDVMKQVKDLSNKVVTMQAQMSALALSSVTPVTTKTVTNTAPVTARDEIKFSEKVAKVGSSSLDVSIAQRVLTKIGYLINPIDGYFDKGTQTALLNFQKAQGLKQTGEIDSPTKSMLSLYSLNLSPYEIYASKEIMNYMAKNKIDLKVGQSIVRTSTGGVLKLSEKIYIIDGNDEPIEMAKAGSSQYKMVKNSYDPVTGTSEYLLLHLGGGTWWLAAEVTINRNLEISRVWHAYY